MFKLFLFICVFAAAAAIVAIIGAAFALFENEKQIMIKCLIISAISLMGIVLFAWFIL